MLRNISWDDFWLNPRRLRGSDFLMRWSQGVWSEQRLIEAINATKEYMALPYGPSGTAPQNDVRAFELYFERLEAAGLGQVKRPDLLIFQRDVYEDQVQKMLAKIGGIAELPFLPEDMLRELIALAKIAVECEQSLWIAEKMPDYATAMRPMKRLGNKYGFKKNAVLPTIILKEEDWHPLQEWQKMHSIPIHIWHVFFERAYGIALDEAIYRIEHGFIEPTTQVFQAPSGATTKKTIYKIYYQYGYPLAVATQPATAVAEYIEDRNGHILPYVRFVGGQMDVLPDVRTMLATL
ncbi:MAG: type II restriction endonuclease [[Chlorobium] sp. 445]|nr:MAG: type II restriction endonuclease [[Chlorobium] sp. 445]